MSTTRYDLQAKNIHTDSDKAKLLYISSAKYGGDWFSVPHTHNCAELFYVIGGKGQFLVTDRSFTITAGAVKLIVVEYLVIWYTISKTKEVTL